MTLLERAAILLASLALAIGLIALLSGFFAGHDPGTVSTPAAHGAPHAPHRAKPSPSP